MPKIDPIPYHKATHLVVDIETLGITIPTPILSLGYVILDFANQVSSPVTTGLSFNSRTRFSVPDTPRPRRCFGGGRQ